MPSAGAPSPVQEPSGAWNESERAELKKADRAPEAQLLAQGIDAARNGDYAGAIAVLKPLANKGAPSVRREAALWLARSYRASDNCSAALSLYAPLVESSSASAALIAEAVDCYERTGDAKQAAVLRSRLQPAKSKAGTAKPAAAPKD